MSRSGHIVIPDCFHGEGSWDEWIDHFNIIAAVNEWYDANKPLWLPVRLTGEGPNSFSKVTRSNQGGFWKTQLSYNGRDLNHRKSETCVWLSTEEWADYGKEVRVLADKARPNLQLGRDWH